MTWVDVSRFPINSIVSKPVTPMSSIKEATRSFNVVCCCSNNVVNPWIERKVITVRLMKCCITSKEAHRRRGGVDANCFDSTCTNNSGQWILNHLVMFPVDNHRLIMRGHVVFISAINFCWQIIWVMKLVTIVKKHSLTTSFIMCSMTRFSWCAPHQIRIKGQSSCMAASNQVTTPATQSVILRAPSNAKPIRRIVQSGQSTIKNLFTMSNITSPIWLSNIGSAHPWRLTMMLCSSMKT